MFQTTNQYWDCECADGAGSGNFTYIHPAKENSCKLCGATREEQPDSRVHEVQAAGLPLDMTEKFEEHSWGVKGLG